MIKYSISAILRNFGLIRLTDKLRFYYFYIKTIGSRKKFRKVYPEIKTPPPYYFYETFNLNYFSFYHGSKESADRLAVFFNKYKGLEKLKVLDWGCGPGRVIRHLPSIMDPSCQFYGTDYNIKYIEWCKKNIPGVVFSHNSPSPPLEYENSTFDIVYGISIFTHLSEEMHFAWFKDPMFKKRKPEQ